MNGHGTALQCMAIAGAVVGLLWVFGTVGPPLAQLGSVRAQEVPARRAPARTPFARAPIASASIVAGTDASIAEFPFQVALYNPHAGSPAKGFFCGGVILDATRVATAAHCLVRESGQHSPPSEIAVLAGSTYLDLPEPGSVRDAVTSTTVDPRYRPASSDYDVGVLGLARPLWSGPAPIPTGLDAIAPLSLDPARVAALSGAGNGSPVQATVSGWGEENPEPGAAPYYPQRLHKAPVSLVPNFLCEEDYAAIEQAITPRMLCAGGTPLGGLSRTDSCYGDSGGPLIGVQPGAGAGPAADVLLGLVDFGNGCGQTGYPGVYVRVADGAIVRFLRASLPQASAGNVHRGVCLTPVRGGHGGRRPHRPVHRGHRCRT